MVRQCKFFASLELKHKWLCRIEGKKINAYYGTALYNISKTTLIFEIYKMNVKVVFYKDYRRIKNGIRKMVFKLPHFNHKRMHFWNKRKLKPDPELILYKFTPIQIFNSIQYFNGNSTAYWHDPINIKSTTQDKRHWRGDKNELKWTFSTREGETNKKYYWWFLYLFCKTWNMGYKKGKGK